MSFISKLQLSHTIIYFKIDIQMPGARPSRAGLSRLGLRQFLQELTVEILAILYARVFRANRNIRARLEASELLESVKQLEFLTTCTSLAFSFNGITKMMIDSLK